MGSTAKATPRSTCTQAWGRPAPAHFSRAAVSILTLRAASAGPAAAWRFRRGLALAACTIRVARVPGSERRLRENARKRVVFGPQQNESKYGFPMQATCHSSNARGPVVLQRRRLAKRLGELGFLVGSNRWALHRHKHLFTRLAYRDRRLPARQHSGLIVRLRSTRTGASCSPKALHGDAWPKWEVVGTPRGFTARSERRRPEGLCPRSGVFRERPSPPVSSRGHP